MRASYVRRLIREEAGGTMVEYALLAALIGMVLFGVLSVMGGSLSDAFAYLSAELSARTPSGGS